FIVDSYHYTNHRKKHYLCHKYCNPAPTNGQAPNLVIVEQSEDGRPIARRAFNTQVCEQLNAWLGGFESIAKCMTPSNFNWFIHAMLFYHTKYVITRQHIKKKKKEATETEDD
ncbi:hypothetical protein K443DRAFT_75986, partial [Laccaria amethystina LaAM-08-1]